MTQLTDDQLDAIRGFDTCALANAIETFDLRLRNEGYTWPGLKCFTTGLGSVLGYAATCRVKSDSPPAAGNAYYYDRTDWWDVIERLPTPRVAVVEDVDSHPGLGGSVGEVHASILRALHCVGVVTNGSVRDIPAVSAMQFPMFARSLSVSHAYIHMVGFGEPVEICGLRIRPGDLLYGDCHGILSIPIEIAPELPRVAQGIVSRERRIIDLCRSGNFSLEKLRNEIRHIQL